MKRSASENRDLEPAEKRVGRIAARLDGVDFERSDPPAELWGRIVTSLASDKQSPPTRLGDERDPGPQRSDERDGTVVEYCIDADDVVTTVERDWGRFARDNQAPEIATLPPGRTLWSYFDGAEVRELWQLLVGRVRTERTQVTVPFRCDSPEARRWFEMTIVPERDGRVRFRSVLLYEEPRVTVTLLDSRAERDSDAAAVPLCSWCAHGYDGTRWLAVDELVRERRLLEQTPPPPVSHGICPTCRDLMSSELLVPSRTRESPS